MTQTFFNKLPKGLHLVQNLDGTASIVGVPDDLPGYYKFKLRCEDTDGNAVTKEFEIAIGEIISLLHFDAPNGTTSIADETGRSWTRRGTVSNISTTESKFGGSSLFVSSINGNNGFFTAHDSSLNVDEPISISCWARLSATVSGTPFYPIFDKSTTHTLPTSGFRSNITRNPQNTLVYSYNTTSGSNNAMGGDIFGPEPQALEWQYLHYEFTPNSIRMQKNDEKTDNVYIMPPADNTTPFHIGGATYGNNYIFPGYIDEFKIVKGVEYLNKTLPVPTAPSDYPQPALTISINGYAPASYAYNPYITTTSIEIKGTAPFNVETVNMPSTYTAVVNGNYVELSGPPLPSGSYTFKIIAKDAMNNTATLPVTMTMKAFEWLVESPASETITITGGNDDYVGVYVYGGSLPNGISYSLVDGKIVLSGTPTGLINEAYNRCVFKVIDSDDNEIFVRIGWNLLYDIEWTPNNLQQIPEIWMDHKSDIVRTANDCDAWVNDGSLSGGFTQNDSSSKPIINDSGLNNHRIIEFDGVNDKLVDGSVGGTEVIRNVPEAWCFITYKSDSTNDAGRYVFSINEQSNTNSRFAYAGSTTGFVNTPSIGGRSLSSDSYSDIKSSTTVGTSWTTTYSKIDFLNKTGYLKVDGSSMESGTLTNMTASLSENITHDSPVLGSNGNVLFFAGDIASILFGTNPINEYEINRLEGYYSHEYALNTNLPSNHPFRYVPPFIGTPILNDDIMIGDLVFGFVPENVSNKVGVSKGDTNYGILLNNYPSLSVGENFSIVSDSTTTLIFESSIIPSTINMANLYNHKGVKLASIPLTYSNDSVSGSTSYMLDENHVYYIRFEEKTYTLTDSYVNEDTDSYVNSVSDGYYSNSRSTGGGVIIDGSVGLWYIGIPVTSSLTVSGGTGTYASVSILDGVLPLGVNVSLSGDSIIFSGRPTNSSVLNDSILLSVTDTSGNVGTLIVEWNIIELTYSHWSSTDKKSTAMLSDNNKVVYGNTTIGAQVNSVTSKSSGKWRVQFVIENNMPPISGYPTPGLGISTMPVVSSGDWLGYTNTGWALYGNYSGGLRMYNSNNSVAYYSNNVYTNGDTIDLLIDIDQGKGWFRKNGITILGDPALGTSPMFTFTPLSTIFLAADPYGNSIIRLKTDPLEMNGDSVNDFVDGWPNE